MYINLNRKLQNCTTYDINLHIGLFDCAALSSVLNKLKNGDTHIKLQWIKTLTSNLKIINYSTDMLLNCTDGKSDFYTSLNLPEVDINLRLVFSESELLLTMGLFHNLESATSINNLFNDELPPLLLCDIVYTVFKFKNFLQQLKDNS